MHDQVSDQNRLRSRLSRRGVLQVAAAGSGAVAAGLALGRRRLVAQQPAQGPQVTASLTRIAEDVFMWSNSGYNMMIILTDDGPIATDPSGQFNRAAPPLYKAAIQSLTDKPVRYLVYSHDHADHNTGGDVFADTAEIVGHRLSAAKIAARNDPRSPSVPTNYGRTR